MAFLVSPGVQVIEKDLSAIIPAVSSTKVGFVGPFNWGPCDEIVSVSREDLLVSYFGKPVGSELDSGDGVKTENAASWLTASAILAYCNSLNVVRVVETNNVSGSVVAATNARAGNSATGNVTIKNQDAYDVYDPATTGIETVAKYPGYLGNSIKVSFCDKDTFENITLTGNITVNGTTAVTGGSTKFLTELYVGAQFTLSGVSSEVFTVAAIASDTALTLATAAVASATGTGTLLFWEYADLFAGAPGTSSNVSSRGGADDEVHIVVVDTLGYFSDGIANTVLETYPYLSKAVDAKALDGSSNYYKTKLEGSPYVWIVEDIFAKRNATTPQPATHDFADMALTIPLTYTLTLGQDGTAPSNGDLELGFDLFNDAEAVDISILVQPPASTRSDSTILGNYLIGICESRKDCVCTLSPATTETVGVVATAQPTNHLAWNATLNSSSYAFKATSWKLAYDKYNDKNRWIPMSGDIAGIMAASDQNNDPWFSPAGINRGQVKNAIKLSYSPNQADRDELYPKGINPVVRILGSGTFLYGDRTALARPSAFDRINVRRLFIILEKSIATAARAQLFEFNDEITRTLFKNAVEPYLRTVQGRRGLTDFKVVCDETNNTPEVIGRNEFVADIYIKPNLSINFIRLNFVAVRQDANFAEIAGV